MPNDTRCNLSPAKHDVAPGDGHPAGLARRQFLLCLAIGLAAGAVTYWALSAYILRQAEASIENLLLSHKGMHHYVQKVMHPALYAYKGQGKIDKDFYAPELFSSSFIVLNQHRFYNQERQEAGLPGLYYKLAANNPRNLTNRADPQEAEMIQRFNADRSLKKIRQIVDVQGGRHLYVALPFAENDERCLTCHGDRQDAPRELQDLYPGEGGFNERAGGIRAIISIRAPLNEEGKLSATLASAVAFGLFALLALFFFNNRLRETCRASTQSLHDSEEYLRAIKESMQVGMLLIDETTKTITDVNTTTLTMLKAERQSMLGSACANFLQTIGGGACPFTEGKDLDRLETRLRDSQGREFPILATTARIEGKRLVTFIDISQRKEEERLVLESERKLRALLESTSSCPWEMELQSRRFTYMGGQIETILGYPVQSWSDLSVWISRLHPEDQDWAPKFCAAETAAGRDHEFVYRAMHRDGSSRWIRDVVTVVVDADGRPHKLAGFLQDITQQKKMELDKEELELRLRQSQKLEAIGTLAGGIAHDFNNILGVILGYADIAIDDAPPESPRLAEDLERIKSAGHRAKDLIRQILAFSRQTEVERIPVSPRHIVKEALKMLRASIPATITIHDRIAADCGCVEADPSQLHQIIMNLCTNAYHAMEDRGGTLTVELQSARELPTELTLVGSRRPEDFMVLTVEDTGCGMPPEVMSRIFDPFFTTKSAGKGTGMGLSITHGIVHEYGGAILVDSSPGRGSTFHIYLPKCQQESAPALPAKEDVPGGTERILLVDDEEALGQMAKDMLSRLGYSVTLHQRSIEALAAFMDAPHDFDLVITDQTMPGLTGLDLARRLLDTRPELPIILCTGYSHLVSEEIARANGIKGFLLKPLSKQTLAALIRSVLDEAKAKSDA